MRIVRQLLCAVAHMLVGPQGQIINMATTVPQQIVSWTIRADDICQAVVPWEIIELTLY